MRKHKSDRVIGAFTLILLAIGLVVIYAIGPLRANFSNAAYGTTFDENYFFFHQLITVGISLFAFIFAFKFLPYEKVKKFSWIVLVLGFVACAVLQIAAWANAESIASCQLGACRWLKIGSLGTLQPAEILKLGLILYLAQLIAKRKEEGSLDTSDFWVPFSVVSVLSILFVCVFQADLGSTVVIVAILLAMLFVSGMKISKIALVIGVLLLGGVLAILTSPHRMERMMTFTDAEDADSYHIDNALLAIGTGGIFGVGVGNTVQATGYLPESINDSIFAVMGETFGFVGLCVILMCFCILLYRILRTVEFAGKDEYALISAGVFAWILTHVVVNIAAMTGLIPLTGITLPLLSYGGTSLAFTSFGLGLVTQLSCYSKREVKEDKITKISQRGVRK